MTTMMKDGMIEDWDLFENRLVPQPLTTVTYYNSLTVGTSGSLALLYFLLGFHGGRQGSGPNRRRSPVEWGDFPSVRLSVCPSVPPSGPSSQAFGPASHP